MEEAVRVTVVVVIAKGRKKKTITKIANKQDYDQSVINSGVWIRV